MVSFALITEGITDQAVIETILEGHYEETEIDVRPLQPMRDQTDMSRQGEFGGWEKVIEYCSADIFQESFAFNDYVVIQIDTDCCPHPSIDIPLTEGGVERSVQSLVDDLKELLALKIGGEVYENLSDRIFFAIAVHSTECWILPQYGENRSQKSRTQSCETHLNSILNRIDIGFSKDYRGYQKLVKPYLKGKNLIGARAHAHSLNVFLSSLPVL